MIVYNGKIGLKSSLNYTDVERLSYGDGFFETMRFVNGSIYNYAFHLKRINKAFQIFHFDSTFFEKLNLLEQINKLKLKGTHRIKVQFIRKKGGKYFTKENKPNYLIESTPLNNNTFIFNTIGLKLYKSEVVRFSQSPFANIKKIGSSELVLNGISALKDGFDDGIMYNENDAVTECTSSNIFIVKNGEISTPLLSDGCVEGTIRSLLIQECSKTMSIQERTLTESDIINADELFLTNSIKGIQWVANYKNSNYTNIIARKLIDLLNTK